MDNFNKIPNLMKKKTIQRAKNIMTKLALLNLEENNSALKNELMIFFRDKLEEDNHIKETISIIFHDELVKLGVISENFPQKKLAYEEQKKQSPEKKENLEKNKQEIPNIYNN